MAKADLRKADTWWLEEMGRVVTRTQALSGLSLKEFADAIHRDTRQVARWKDGKERPQFDAIVAIDRLRPCLTQAFAEATGATVEIVVRCQRAV